MFSEILINWSPPTLWTVPNLISHTQKCKLLVQAFVQVLNSSSWKKDQISFRATRCKEENTQPAVSPSPPEMRQVHRKVLVSRWIGGSPRPEPGHRAAVFLLTRLTWLQPALSEPFWYLIWKFLLSLIQVTNDLFVTVVSRWDPWYFFFLSLSMELLENVFILNEREGRGWESKNSLKELLLSWTTSVHPLPKSQDAHLVYISEFSDLCRCELTKSHDLSKWKCLYGINWKGVLDGRDG